MDGGEVGCMIGLDVCLIFQTLSCFMLLWCVH